MEGSRYVHGTEPEEQRRLSRLNTLMNDACLRELSLSGGERILDVGAGLGQFTRAMGRAVAAAAPVVAVERDPRQLEEALHQARADAEEHLLDLRHGNALDLPLRDEEWGRFDLAHTRFLLEHVPDPLEAVRAMVRAVRPGGRVVLADDDHDVLRLWPEPDGFVALWTAYMHTFEALGNDPLVGRRLVSLLDQAGARPWRNTWIFFGGCAGSDAWETLVENLVGVIESARGSVLGHALLSEDAFDGALESARLWSRRPDAAIWYAICWAEGVR